MTNVALFIDFQVAKRKGGTELTGNLMTGSYCLGLTLGAGAAYLCDWVLETLLAYQPGTHVREECLKASCDVKHFIHSKIIQIP